MPRPFSGYERVERVAGLHVGEVRPRAEHAQRPQLAAVLVRDDVVGIVGAGALVAEAAEDLARQQPRRGGAVGAVGVPVRALEHLGQIVFESAGVRSPDGRRVVAPGSMSMWRGSTVVMNVSTWL